MKKFIIFLILITLFTQYTALSQWVKQTIPVSNKPITGIKFTDTLNGWAVTYNYTETNQDTSYILHTTNGGTNWFVQLMKIPFDFDALFMVDNSVGYVSLDSIGGVPPFTTAWPRLYKTTNGGINWDNIPLVPNMAISNMQFLNRDTGWEFQYASGPDIRLTTDGGLTWQVRVNGILSGITTLFFLNYNTGFCGAQFNLYKTTNAGMNWSPIGSFSNQTVSLFFVNDNTGWLGGGNSGGNGTMWTTNGGINWNLGQGFPGGYDIFFINEKTGWAGQPFEKFAKTTDGGHNWGFQIDSGGSRHISFVDSLHGWTGDYGIYHTSNGGGPLLEVKKISSKIPVSFKLYQNFPNPFNPTTTIKYALPKDVKVTIKIYDILGKLVITLVNGELKKAGYYEATFNGNNFASGVYFYRIEAADFVQSKKMVLVK